MKVRAVVSESDERTCNLCREVDQVSSGVVINNAFICGDCCEEIDNGGLPMVKQENMYCAVHNGGFSADELDGYQLANKAIVCDTCREEALERMVQGLEEPEGGTDGGSGLGPE